MGDFKWKPYVSVAQRQRRAEKEVAKLRKQGNPVAPVTTAGPKIASSVWGKSWCMNLERHADIENRLPRGKSYVRNGLVVDLQIARGVVTALVCGTALYRIRIGITPAPTKRWQKICRDCTGTVGSLVELLQGRLATGVMERVCREDDGLFPGPGELTLSCDCPDWASMCKHVAAALYAIGTRLDERPELLFVLRGVEASDLLSRAGHDLSFTTGVPSSAIVLADEDVAALFDVDMPEDCDPVVPAPIRVQAKRSRPRKSRTQQEQDSTAPEQQKAIAKVPVQEEAGRRESSRVRRKTGKVPIRTALKEKRAKRRDRAEGR